MLAKIKSSSAKRAKLKITTGVVHISSTFNNTIVTITDTKGNTIAWSSAGATGFKGARKGTPFAAQTASEAATAKVRITSAGHLVPTADDSYDLGTASLQWRNIYTGDLHLSNMTKDIGNIVDGSKGDWTIQEGSEDLFLINNNSGKKYKFNLTEV